MVITNSLKQRYEQEIVPALQERFRYENFHAVPRLVKITLNMGVGEAVLDRKKIEGAITDLTLISGQKPVVTKAKKSVANYKLREGWAIGCKVTLRRLAMYEFLERLIYTAIPRVRDFRGLSPRSFDGRGNYSFGIREQIIFPEVDYDKIDALRGLDVTITTSANTDEGAKALLSCFLPFRSS